MRSFDNFGRVDWVLPFDNSALIACIVSGYAIERGPRLGLQSLSTSSHQILLNNFPNVLSVVLCVFYERSFAPMVDYPSIPMTICSWQRVLLDVLPLEINLVRCLNCRWIVMPLLPNMLMTFALMLALAATLLLRFLARAFAFLEGIVEQNWLLKLGSVREIRRRTFVLATLTNLGDTLIVVEVGVERFARLVVLAGAGDHEISG